MPEFATTDVYQPTGDQPKAIETLVEGLAAGDRFQTLVGATGTGKTATMAWTLATVCGSPPTSRASARDLHALFRFEDPVSSPVRCSFDITWSGPVTNRSPVSGPSGSSGQLVMCDATMQWSATNGLGFRFDTDPTAPTKSVFAQLGKVMNGVFAD